MPNALDKMIAREQISPTGEKQTKLRPLGKYLAFMALVGFVAVVLGVAVLLLGGLRGVTH